MTATERLRQLLDERGVKWIPSAWDAKTETLWHTSDGISCLAIQGEAKLRVSFADYFTPEQAVEATLGRGTCKVETTYCDMWKCDECGEVWWQSAAPCYCPSCGREVVE